MVEKLSSWWAGLGSLTRVLVVVIGCLAVLGVANSVITEDDEPVRYVPAVTNSEVVYELEGTVAYADATIVTPTGFEQLTPDVPLVTKAGDVGLTYTFRSGASVSISAQKKDAVGSITCRISVDGLVVSENTSTAAYGIASCRGQA